MVPTFLTVEVAQAAESGQVARITKWLNEGGPVNARDVCRCSLLHLAAGAGQEAVIRELIRRGADLDGHVEVVELLVAAGANTTLSFTKPSLAVRQIRAGRPNRNCRLQQGSRCKSDMAAATLSSRDLCKTDAVRLALERPPWSKQNHVLWPDRFKAVVQQLLFLFLSHRHDNKENEHVTQYCPLSSFSLSRRSAKANPSSAETQSVSLHLDWDTLQEIIARLAYPVSQWCDSSPTPTTAAPQTKELSACSRPRSWRKQL